MSSPDQKFKKRWSDHLTFYQDTAQGMDEKTIQFIFQKFPSAKSSGIMIVIDDWIQREQGEDGKPFTQ